MTKRHLPILLGTLILAANAVQAARVVAVGDVHGEIAGFDAILRAAGLTDEEGRWVGGDTILVQTGDLTDRGPQVRAVMDRLRSLERQALAQGGRVVALLGNHEISNLSHLFDRSSTPSAVYHQIWADFAAPDSEKRQRAARKQWRRWQQRYPGCVKKKNVAWVADRLSWLEDHPPGFVEYLEALSPDGEYGRWLRTLDAAAEIDGTIFLHGGLSPQLLERGYRSVEAINQAVAQAMEQLDADRRRLVAENLILPFSTLWETACALYVEMARLEKINSARAMARRAELEEINSRLPGTPGFFPTDQHGPLWYRGLATAEEADLASGLDDVLAAFGARRIAVGHTPQPGSIRARFDDRVFLLDTAMAYADLGGRAAALEIDGDRVTAIYPDRRVALGGGTEAAASSEASPEPQPVEGTNGHDPPVEASNGQDEPERNAGAGPEPDGPAEGEATAAPPASAAPPRPVWIGPDGEPLPFDTLAQVLEFLAEAKVIKSTKIGTGVTLPRKLLLERDGVRAHAIFHDVAVERPQERQADGRIIPFYRDHYNNNVAAFELSRLLGLSNVPPAVVRKIGSETGSVQLWIENSNTEVDRRQIEVVPKGKWLLSARDMHIFDNLANNIDRHQGNILYDGDWNLWLIDHTRAFSPVKRLPEPTRVKRCSRRLYEALKALDEAQVRQRLGPYLGTYELRALMARRDVLLELIDERIGASSEAAVLFDYDDPTLDAASEAALESTEPPPGASNTGYRSGAGRRPAPVPVEGSNGHGEPMQASTGHDEPEGTNGHDLLAAAAAQAPHEPAAAADSKDQGPAPAAASPAAPPVWLGADGEPLPFETIEELLEFLAEAKVLKSKRVGVGITLPQKLLLERDGVRAHAIFHTVAIEKRRERLRDGMVVNFFRDHYKNNIAAFELSRLLGMTNVPPVVERRIGRNRGSVQLWIENSSTEADRRRRGIAPEGDWRLTSMDMQVFDNLANNIDRNQGNILYDGDWNLWLIDHTRTFSRTKELPKPTRVRRCSRRLYEALRDLDEAEVRQRLRPYLGAYEIGGMMARRDLLLELIEERSGATSELAVLFDYGDSTVELDSDLEIPEAPAETTTGYEDSTGD